MSITDISPQALSALKEQREQLWSSIEAILEENERLRAELVARPVAVEVPPLDSGANPNQRGLEHPGSGGWLLHQTYLDGYNAARKAARSIPTTRILKEGERAVPLDQWESIQWVLSVVNGWANKGAHGHLDAGSGNRMHAGTQFTGVLRDALRSKGSE